MNDRPYPDTDPQDDDDSKGLTFILPAYVSALGFSCAREWTEERSGMQCGCPRCLRKNGLVLIFHQGDWREDLDCQEQWRVRIVSAKTASYAKHLICPGYDGESPEEIIDGFNAENPDG